MKSFLKIIYFGVFIIIFSCENNSSSRDVTNNSSQTIVKNDSLIMNWKKDSLGCLMYRRFELAENLFIKYELEGKDVNKIIEVFGKPNEYNIDIKGTCGEMIYYCNSICYKNKIIDSSEKQWVLFVFENKKVKSIHLVSD